MRKFAAYSIRIVSLVPLAIGCGLTLVSARALRFADELEGCVSELKHETGEECREPEELVIPSPVLYEAFSILISHGKKSKEWIVALGAQELNGKLVITRVYDVNCAISHTTGAEVEITKASPRRSGSTKNVAIRLRDLHTFILGIPKQYRQVLLISKLIDIGKGCTKESSSESFSTIQEFSEYFTVESAV